MCIRDRLNGYLEKVYSQKRTLFLDEVIRFSHDIIQGIIHLHVLDIVHLDLKASNIYIGDDGKLVIGDFGQAKFIKDGIINNPPNIYPAIIPSEANKKKAIDKTADIYQFGLLLYSMLCYNQYRHSIDNVFKINTANLKAIFQEKSENSEALKKEFRVNVKKYFDAVDNSEFPDSKTYPYYVPQELQEIINKCLAPIDSGRYNNFYQVQNDINKFIFPKDVSNFFQDLETNVIHFTKEDKPCTITINKTKTKYSINSKKNGQAVNRCCKTDISETMLRKKMFMFARDI